jgi:hypothetical protein
MFIRHRINCWSATAAYRRAGGKFASDPETSAHEALLWLCRAQDSVEGGGFSRAYSLLRGWELPYPETTGYIIPTLLRFASKFPQLHLTERAGRAGAWLCEVQFPSGALCRKQYYIGNTTPSVFNTGMGLHGWISLAEGQGDERCLDAARRAADWIVAQQEADGSWIRHAFNGMPHTYYTMVDWALARMYKLIGETRYRDASVKHLDWTLRYQRRNGWFDRCGFGEENTATTHTISYTTQGLIEAGLLLAEQKYVEAAKNCATNLLAHFQRENKLAGLFGPDWKPLVNWECLTGDAQTSIVWSELGKIYGEPIWQDSARAINSRTMMSQKIGTGVPGVDGGILGSRPISGNYDPFSFPNHAAKFHLDALHLAAHCDCHPCGSGNPATARELATITSEQAPS